MNVSVANLLVSDIELTAVGGWVLIALAVVLGGAFGSFINVVAYRLPRRMSLSRPGSQCPSCRRPIRWHDNVPVFGWLRLRGRCRDCGVDISPRYPLVEALVAMVSGLLAWKAMGLWTADVAPNGVTVSEMDFAFFAFHLLLACTLISASLIEFDGYLPPRRLIWVPLAAGLAMLLPWRHLLPWSDLIRTDGVAASCVGMASALGIGVGPWFTWFMSVKQSRLAYATAALAELVLVGGFLGDHAVLSIGVGSMLVYLIVPILARRFPPAGRFGWAGPLTAVTLVWIFTGPDLMPLDLALPADGVSRLIVGGVIMAVLAITLQLVSPPAREFRQP
jgi:prepilin signal peptidase PulO-like enzyme (type II secretory pathway)